MGIMIKLKIGFGQGGFYYWGVFEVPTLSLAKYEFI